ncbi:hypothetical protein K402DRAFT_397747 [Aulographum hederae CBS 113979]|uniref:VPS9 domain-containing protein n=1 Tax=Aulographum hederae CBS 113979 TaxID=1176131 RepID=A0A6G1GNH0_9PEZI|nr:hypothetical protein K402DRAFT_397747 [Aulographum hederae CBS 113979]
MAAELPHGSRRPNTLHVSKSFSRLEPSHQNPLNRARASTLQGPPIPEILYPENVTESPVDEDPTEKGDIFETRDEEDAGTEPATGNDTPVMKLPGTFEDLPIEIRSLTERFLESLSAKVHPSPMSIDTLSDLFQDFYIRAEQNISTHIAILSSRISREKSPGRSASSQSKSRKSSGSKKDGSTESLIGSDQQMLTASEVANRKRARKLLEIKRGVLEESVERAVCEKVYDRIYRHRSTDDEERDQKLRSRTAALSLVGISLKELLVNANDITEKSDDQDDKIKEWLSGARESLRAMDEEHYPLAKLSHLLAAHKSIVETLSRLFPSSSSADEILPTLIYTLITSPPEHINVVSNLYFIQRFRATHKVQGHASYCLVNLEAAISFLETVDLSSLRSDEAPEGPDKSPNSGSRPTTPLPPSSPMNLGVSPASNPAISPVSTNVSDMAKPRPSQSRRVSQMITQQTSRIEAASDSFRDAVLDSADSAFDTINNTLENSFKFLFGRIKEQQQEQQKKVQGGSLVEGQNVVVPKTLEEARKLVTEEEERGRDEREDGSVASVASSVMDHEEIIDDPLSAIENPDKPLPAEHRVLEMIGGKKPVRDQSVDSARSGGSSSGKRVAFRDSAKTVGGNTATPPTGPTLQPNSSPMAPGSSPSPAPQGMAAIEGMKNFGNSLNPLNRFSGMGLFGRGGQAPPSPVHAPSPAPDVASTGKHVDDAAPSGEKGVKVLSEKEEKALETLEELKRVTLTAPKRFVDCRDARELRVGDVEELLKEYQRLVQSVRGVMRG